MPQGYEIRPLACLTAERRARSSLMNPRYRCESRDSNPDAVRRQILSLLRLPVPPLPLRGESYLGASAVAVSRLSVDRLDGRPRDAGAVPRPAVHRSTDQPTTAARAPRARSQSPTCSDTACVVPCDPRSAARRTRGTSPRRPSCSPESTASRSAGVCSSRRGPGLITCSRIVWSANSLPYAGPVTFTSLTSKPRRYGSATRARVTSAGDTGSTVMPSLSNWRLSARRWQRPTPARPPTRPAAPRRAPRRASP